MKSAARAFRLHWLSCCFIAAMGVNAFAQGAVVRVTAERTSLRDKPATDGVAVAALVKGDELELMEESGTWYHVRINASGKEGYVHSLLVEKILPGSRPTTQPVGPPVGTKGEGHNPPPARTRPAVGASAQTAGVGIGIKGGMNFSTVAGPNVTAAAKHVTDVTGGLFVSGSFSRIIGFQVEALLSQKGVKFASGADEGRLTVTYLDVPVLFRVGVLGDSDSSRAHVFLGSTMGLKLSSSATFNGTNDTSFRDTDVTRFDPGLTIGAAGTFGRIELDARYTFGLRTIFATAPPQDAKSRSFSVLAGYRVK